MQYHFVICYIKFGCWLFRHRLVARFLIDLLISRFLLVLDSTVFLCPDSHGTHHRTIVCDDTGNLHTTVLAFRLL
jgi:hypothetical protein